jgi:hypothetical protein
MHVHVKKSPLFPTIRGNYRLRKDLTQWASQWASKIAAHCPPTYPLFNQE